MTSYFASTRHFRVAALLLWSSLASCGGGGSGGGSSSSQSYSIGGSVSGLPAGGSVVLQDNGGDALTVSANAGFVFANRMLSGGTYDITVLNQPAGVYCTVTGGSGKVMAANVTGVQVTCAEAHWISGTVVGLTPGTSVTLLDNGTDPLVVGSNPAFTFPTPLGRLASYNVTIGTQPPGQTCGVNYGVGGALIADVTNVIVECTTETVLWSFGGGSDGSGPGGGLIQGPDGALYGTTTNGGKFGQGTVYRITLDGVLTILWSFGSGMDGSDPTGALVIGSDGNFYGTTAGGGTNLRGTVYRLSPLGEEAVLWNFGMDANDGQNPTAGLVLGRDGNFYGTTANGGTAGYGTAFRLTPLGAETVLWNFWVVPGDSQTPAAPLIQASDGIFYSLSVYGGLGDWGTAYSLTADGVLSVLWSFIPSSTMQSDGFGPVAPVVEGPDGFLYGTTYNGGFSTGLCPCGNGSGAVVRLDEAGSAVVGSGSEETMFWRFGESGPNDGGGPQAGLIVAKDGNFYGTTSYGGAFNGGTAYKITPAGLETVIFSFGVGNDAANLQAPLTQASDGNLYGVSLSGGAHGLGTVFRITR